MTLPAPMENELNRLGVLPRAKPKAKPASGPIATVEKGEEPSW